MVTRDCNGCPLSKAFFVPGYGPKDPLLVLVGEAPGYEEHRAGIPFVGPSGRLLNRLLREAGLNREQIFITNIVHCFAEDSREQIARAAKFCKRVLAEELRELTCRHVILAGVAATRAIVSRGTLSEVRGGCIRKVFADKDLYCFPTFHPAAALRDPSLEAAIIADLKRARQAALGNRRQVTCNYRFLDSEQELAKLLPILEAAESLAIDCETTSTDLLDGNIICISLSWAEGQAAVVPFELVRLLGPIFKKESMKIFHNAKFDLKFLEKAGFEIKGPRFDTMLAHHLLKPESSQELKYLATLYTDFEPWSFDWKSCPRPSAKDLFMYAAKDADATFRLYKILAGKLEEDPQLNNLFQELIMPLSAAVANVEKAGICFDSERLSQISALVKEKISALEHDLERQIGKRINYFSHKQLSEFLYEGLRIRSEARTASGKLSTDKKALESFASRHPAIKTILRLRALKKLLNTYLDGPAGRSGLRSWVKSDGKIYPNYLLHGTVTGRLSCKEPNLQNIPRIASIRQLFVAEAGYKLLEADYDQAELRVAAALSNDPLFLEDLRDDIHRRVASIIFGKSYEAVSDSERSKAKGVTFGILYGSSARGLSELIAISEEEARTFINSFLDRYQVLARWFQRLVFEAKRKGYVRNRFGRIRYFTFRDADENQRAEFFRQVINFPIQSTLADIVSRATILLDSALQGLNGRTVALMHDAFLIEVPEANVLQYSELVEALMKEACPKDLPLPVKIKIGNRWWDGVSDDFLELEVQSTP